MIGEHLSSQNTAKIELFFSEYDIYVRVVECSGIAEHAMLSNPEAAH
jgi:hypothetical protein